MAPGWRCVQRMDSLCLSGLPPKPKFTTLLQLTYSPHLSLLHSLGTWCFWLFALALSQRFLLSPRAQSHAFALSAKFHLNLYTLSFAKCNTNTQTSHYRLKPSKQSGLIFSANLFHRLFRSGVVSSDWHLLSYYDYWFRTKFEFQLSHNIFPHCWRAITASFGHRERLKMYSAHWSLHFLWWLA